MQTWLVHMRSPMRLLRDLGPVNFLVFQLLIIGTVLAALVHMIFIGQLGYALYAGHINGGIVTGFQVSVLFAGYLVSAILGLVALAHRRLLRCGWVLLLMPLHWLLLSVAAWRALFELIRDPYLWEKTEHGLAHTSRLAPNNGTHAA